MAPATSISNPTARLFRAGRRLLVPLAACLAVLVVTLVVKGRPGRSGDAGQEDVAQETAQVETRPVADSIVRNGRVGFNQNQFAQIVPRVEGVVRNIRADVGAKVQEGDVLAVVDSASLGDTKATYLNSLVKATHYENLVSRYRRLVEQQAIASKSLFEAEHLLEEHHTNASRAKQHLMNLGFSEGQIQQMIEAKDTSTQLPITAPWTGTVVDRKAVEGEVVNHASPLFALADLGSMWIHLSIYESDLRHVHLDQQMRFSADGLPGPEFDGKIDWISPEIDAQTRTVQVRSLVKNPGQALRANMFGKGRILIESSHQSLVVPQTAVQSHGAEHVVFVQRTPEHYELRRVAVGIRNDRFWEITSGVRRGEKVATTGSFLLKSNLENRDFGHVE